MLACRFWEVCIFSSSHTQEALLSLARHPSDRHEKNIQLDIYKMYRKYLYFIDNKKRCEGSGENSGTMFKYQILSI